MIFTTLGVALLLAQAPPNVASEVRQLATIATGLRTEYSADILLRLIETGKIPDRKLRFDLLEQVFQSAPQVLTPLPMTDVASKGDTLSRRLSEAHRQRLDTLSIQLRVVGALLKDDPSKARATFARIPPLVLPRSGCEHPMVADVAEFYVVLRELFDGSNPALLRDRIAEVNSVLQLRPVLDLLETTKLPSTVFDDLTSVLVGQLKNVAGTIREWHAAAPGDIEDWIERIRRIEIRHGRRQNALYSVWRGYGRQCTDSAAKVDPVEVPQRLSDLLRPLYSSRDPRYEKITGVVPDAWEISATRFLDELAGYTTATTSEETRVFEIKSTLYLTAIDNLPEGRLLDRARVDHLQFLRLNALQSKNPLQWLAQLKSLLRFTRETGGERMLDAMKRINDPVIAAYAQLESIAPQPFVLGK
jgi:hypothetical protein